MGSKCLLHRHEHLVWMSELTKKLGIVVCACNPSAEELGISWSAGLAELANSRSVKDHT